MSTHQLSESDLAQLLVGARALAEQAAQAILAVYCEKFAVTQKADYSPLTEADLASHKILDAGLRLLEPRFPVLSEESSPRIFQDCARWKRYWLIDPLDGTKEFISRNGEFAINIALIEDGAPVLGVVHMPAKNEVCFAYRGGGAWRAAGAGAEASPLKVGPAAHPLRVAVSRSHHPIELSASLARLGEHVLSALGSSLKFNAIAAGEMDLYPRLRASSCEWDIAAGQCILEQAGGAVLDRSGKALRYNQCKDVFSLENSANANFLVPAFIAFGDHSVPWLERMQWQT
jgi:3'(2'), 5'-bisphosphate nucleotidase